MHLYLKPRRDIYIDPFGDITKRNYTVIMDEPFNHRVSVPVPETQGRLFYHRISQSQFDENLYHIWNSGDTDFFGTEKPANVDVFEYMSKLKL